MTVRTLASQISAPGTSALASLAVHGDRAWDIVRKFFHPLRTKSAKGTVPATQPLPDLEAFKAESANLARGQRLWFGQFGEEIRDEVVLVLTSAAPTPSVEIHCHGGAEVVRVLLRLLANEGCELVPWQTFAAQIREPSWKARLLDRLAHAPTTRCADYLLQQLDGAWERALHQILARIPARNTLPQVAEGEVAPTAEANENRLALQELERWSEFGKHLVEPWTVVIAGAPNVGKSSLINALAGYARAVVSPIPGTTRDVVRASLAIDGWPIDVLDTAGLRSAHEELERAGIDLAREAIGTADVGIWVFDGSQTPIRPDDSERDWLFVINKSDLPAGWDWASIPDAIPISARTGEGLGRLSEALSRKVVPTPPPAGTAIPWDSRCAEAIGAALSARDSNEMREAVLRAVEG